jgi:hypothetical protein
MLCSRFHLSSLLSINLWFHSHKACETLHRIWNKISCHTNREHLSNPCLSTLHSSHILGMDTIWLVYCHLCKICMTISCMWLWIHHLIGGGRESEERGGCNHIKDIWWRWRKNPLIYVALSNLPSMKCKTSVHMIMRLVSLKYCWIENSIPCSILSCIH